MSTPLSLASIVASLLVMALSGCMAPYESMKNNQYSQVEPQATPDELVGTWTGTSGPYLMAIKLGPEGRGLSCASWQANESVNNVKYAAGRLYFPDGMQMTVGAEGGQLVAVYDRKGMEPIRLNPDTELVEASPYCKDKLR